MKIEKNKVVSIDYKLTNYKNETIDTSEGRDPRAYLHGNGNLIPGLEKALEGKASGDTLKVSIPPEEGYGVRDDSKRADRRAVSSCSRLSPSRMTRSPSTPIIHWQERH